MVFPRPEIVHIKSECGKEFYFYEKCMTENQAETEKCSELYEAFSSCADKALDSFKSLGKIWIDVILE